jgi:Ca2+-binding RTX toxin-like protein
VGDGLPRPADNNFTVRVTASGDHYLGAPRMQIFVDDRLLGTVDVSAVHAAGQWQDFLFTLPDVSQAKAVRVQFINDAYGGPGLDRNLYIKDIAINGTVLLPQAGTYARPYQSSLPGQSLLMMNGGLVFDASPYPVDIRDRMVIDGGDDILRGGDGNDTLIGGAGNNYFHGGTGMDTALYAGRLADYVVRAWDGYNTVTSRRESAATVGQTSDRMVSVEKLTFSDRSVTFAEIRRMPVADTVTMAEDGTARIAVLANDHGLLGGPLSVAEVTQAGHGSVTLNKDGTVTYTPFDGFSGADRFRYTVSDGGSLLASTTVDVTVAAVADTPLLALPAKREVLTSATASTAMPLDLQAALSDTDGSETLSVYVSGVPQAARLSAGKLDAAGRWVLTAADLPNLQLILPAALSSTFQLDVTAVAREQGVNNEASITRVLEVAATAPKPSQDTITLKLSGDGYKGMPTFSLYVDGAKIASQTTVNALHPENKWQDFQFTVDKLGSGSHSLWVAYDQDYGPRTLYIGQISVNGLALDLSKSQYQHSGITDVGQTSLYWAGKLVASFDGATIPSSPPPPTNPPDSPAGSDLGPLPISGNIKPQVMQAGAPADIVGFRLENHQTTAEAAHTVTFGQAFAKGDLMAGQGLFAIINGQRFAVQMDVKATHEDGSVRHAILSFQAPALAAGSALDGMLQKGGAPAPQHALSAQDVLNTGYDLQLRLHLENSGNDRIVTIDAAKLLSEAIRTGTVETWISGASASEFRVESRIDENLRATFDIRIHKDGTVRTDVSLSNDNGLSSTIHTYRYDADIIDHGKVVSHYEDLSHIRNSRWHEQVWQGDGSDLHVVRDTAYLMASGAVPDYDLSQGVSAAAIVQQYQRLLASNHGPMGSALVMKEMEAAGARPDIGTETTWTARYLLSQDPRAEQTMLAMADAAGSVPWYYADPKTGLPITIDDKPNDWLENMAKRSPGDSSQWNGWAIENAHQPALSYVPYLITGDRYYLENLQMQASSNLLRLYPWDRGNDQGLIEAGQQIRGLAWTLRTLADAAWVSPDSDPLNAFFDEKLANNLRQLVQKYVTDDYWGQKGAGEVEGFLMRYTGNQSTPWQNDFLTVVLAEEATRGNEEARTMLTWMDNFISGRFIHADQGFDPYYATGISFDQMDAGGHLYSTWAEVFQATLAKTYPSRPAQMPGFPNEAIGYVANAKASLASMISATGSPDAVEAYGWLQSQSAAGNKSFVSDPTWALAPRLSDGTYLDLSDIRVSTSLSNTTLTGGDANELLHGGRGNDTIGGGGGIDMLFGGDGNDAIKGGPGNDYLFGGNADDMLFGGAGSNYLKGGAGVDRFVFDTAGKGRNTIDDFQPGTDVLEISKNLGGNGLSSAAGVLTKVHADDQGNAVIDLGQGLEILLSGVKPHELLSSSIHMV